MDVKILKLNINWQKKVKKVNKEGFDDILKGDNYILPVVSRANEMVGWMVRTSVSKEPNVVLKMYKIQVRLNIKYYTKTWAPILKHLNWSIKLRLQGIQKRGTKIIKKIKDYS